MKPPDSFNLDSIPFEKLNVSISESEYRNRRPDGRCVEIDRPHWRARFRHVLDLVDEIHDDQDEPILDIGAYRYNIATLLKLRGYSIVGIDKDPTKMSNYIDQEGFDIRQCDIEREELPVESQNYETALFLEVFEHLRIDPIDTLEKINNTIYPDGKLVLSTPNLYYILNYVDFLRGDGIRHLWDGFEEWKQLHEEGFPGHVRIYSESELTDLLQYAGFDICDVYYTGSPYQGKKQVFRPICKMIPRLRSRIYVIATPSPD